MILLILSVHSIAFSQDCDKSVNHVLNFLGHKGYAQNDDRWKSQKFYKENGIPLFLIKNLDHDDVSLLRTPQGQVITSNPISANEFNITYNHFSNSTERLDFRFRRGASNKGCDLVSLVKSSKNDQSKDIESVETCRKIIQNKNCELIKTLFVNKAESQNSQTIRNSNIDH